MRRLGQAQHAAAMAHRVHAEFLERDLLHFAVGRVILDPVLVAAEAVARVQHRRMFVGGEGEIIEPVARQLAQPLEVRFHLLGERRVEIERQHILELPVDRVEVLAVHVGRDVVRTMRLGAGGAGVRHRSLLEHSAGMLAAC